MSPKILRIPKDSHPQELLRELGGFNTQMRGQMLVPKIGQVGRRLNMC
jgi:hypothetical protein